jgi:protocatechuate 3,4-dioxygenase beta subunit
MSSPLHLPTRRLFLVSGAIAATSPFWTVRGAFAEELTRTPGQTEGPFYPNKLPLDTDNDLLVINDGITPAVGEIAHLTGKVLDAKGNPLKNAVVEIWQCDANGVYLHTKDSEPKKDKQDKNFQGFGRFLTGSTGEYYFRTIKPVPYTGRTPHVHVKVRGAGGRELLTTQIFVNGHPQNARDGVLAGVRDAFERELLLVDFKPVPGSKLGELSARFDVVLGRTPDESATRR